MTAVKRKTGLPPGFWLGIIMVLILLFLPLYCKASTYDTIPARPQCIEKVIAEPTQKGDRYRYFVVYRDEQNDLIDLIPITESVVVYLEKCKQNKITPQIGIKLKDGYVYSIIKYKRMYRRKK